jgi:hypothetical protein
LKLFHFYGGPQVPRQKQIHHGESKFITARANSSQQEKIIHSKSKLAMARANYPRQEQITHGKSKFITAKRYILYSNVVFNHLKQPWSAHVRGCYLVPNLQNGGINHSKSRNKLNHKSKWRKKELLSGVKKESRNVILFRKGKENELECNRTLIVYHENLMF